MKFRRLIEGIEFRDVKINSNGDIIDNNTGAVIGTTRDQEGFGGSSGEDYGKGPKEGEEEGKPKKGKGKGKGKGKKIPLDGKLYYDPNHGGIYKKRSLYPVYDDEEDPFAWIDTNITDDDDRFEKGNDENY